MLLLYVHPDFPERNAFLHFVRIFWFFFGETGSMRKKIKKIPVKVENIPIYCAPILSSLR